ncbi:MAG: hypothetical protein QNJ42_10895 [Crocosphaera sp.]|nr:hypothetical protein [Crocosphaera sp.]
MSGRIPHPSILNVVRGLPLHRQVNGEMNDNQPKNRPKGVSVLSVSSLGARSLGGCLTARLRRYESPGSHRYIRLR